MNKFILKDIKKLNAHKEKKKMVATFINKKTLREKNVKFGSKGYEDFTIHKDNERK